MTTRVLIADDHSGFRSQAVKLLETEGFEVLGCAADGSSALSMTADLQPDVLLLDIQLPDISGFEVARRLDTPGNASAIVLISTRELSDYGGDVEAAPVKGFITKAELSGAAIIEVLEEP